MREARSAGKGRQPRRGFAEGWLKASPRLEARWGCRPLILLGVVSEAGCDRYAIHAEGRRTDLRVVSGPLLAYHWYRIQIQERYPDLLLPEPQSKDQTSHDLVWSLIKLNATQRPIYATDPHETWRSWFEFRPGREGPLYEVLPIQDR